MSDASSSGKLSSGRTSEGIVSVEEVAVPTVRASVYTAAFAAREIPSFVAWLLAARLGGGAMTKCPSELSSDAITTREAKSAGCSARVLSRCARKGYHP